MGSTGEMAVGRNRRRLTFVLKGCASIALIVALLSMVDWRQGLPLLSGARLLPATLFLAGFALSIGLSSLKWQSLLVQNGVLVSFWRLFRAYWVGTFAGNFMPSSVGGDAVRLALVGRSGRLSAIAASIFVERLTGFVILLGWSLGSFLLCPQYFGAGWLRPMFLGLFAGLVLALLLAVLFGGRVTLWLKGAPFRPQSLGGRLLGMVGDTMEIIFSYRKQMRPIWLCLGLSLVFYLVRVSMQYAVIVSLGIAVPFPVVLVISPVIDLVWSMPVTLNGLGLVEGTFVLFYTLAGLAPAEALAVAVLARILYLLATLLGGGFWLAEKRA